VRGRRLAAGALAAGLPLASCIDFSPLPFNPDASAGDASVSDAVADIGNIDALTAECATCIDEGPCAAGQAACNANPKCKIFSACLTATYCWRSSLSNLASLPPCVLACAVQAGVTSQNDPGAALLAPIYTCVHDPAGCANVCAPGTAADL
jgi:hypothetical protein